ncbi:MAG: hypothetical protein CW716_01945 [Candidatus Bathyarchaeum sp.]|nr:MAG: hypothetical protein CW716_01945 [Candidatus Bathyarchaeum sp.]
MGRRNVIVLTLVFSLLLLNLNSCLCSEPDTGESGNWVEVAKFTGRVSSTTDYFTCEHVDWRIRWEYDPLSVLFMGLDPLSVTVYPEESATPIVDDISGIGNQSGIRYIHDNAGIFYMQISTNFLEGYTIIVEQNTESAQASVSSSSVNWVELKRFSGNITESDYYTEVFTCNNGDWRIRWEYEVRPEDPPTSGIRFYVYQTTDYQSFFHATSQYGANQPTGGTTYFHDKLGTFVLRIGAKTENFTIIVEQDLNSVPEFPSWTILPLFLTAALVVMIYREKLTKK